jgi:hypothetical protein
MPPFLVALGIAGLYFLIPKKQRVGAGTVSVFPVGQNNYGSPPAVTSGQVNPSGPSTNTPSTAASGLPNTTIQTNKVVNSVQRTPPANNFYYPGTLQPPFSPTDVPTFSPAGECGCGGSCGGCGSGGNGSDCGVSQSRATSSGCLVPSAASNITKQNAPLFNRWFANVASSPDATYMNVFHTFQQNVQEYNPPGEDVTPPAAPTDSNRIGLPRIRMRSPGVILQ